MGDPIYTVRGNQIRRFSTVQIVEHWIQVIAFVMLTVTGIPQRYSGAALSKWTIDLFGGIEATRIIHRWFAVLLMVAVVYHFAAIGYRKFVRKEARGMVPGLDDAKAVGQSFRHALGLRKTPPRQGRFTWEEKAEYWALIWGTVVMIVTGFLLWNPIATTSVLPGDFIPAAKEAHSGEALLAVLAVIVWHMYHVHIRSFNKSMFTGYMSRHEMEEEHPLELEQIDAGVSLGITDEQELARRSKLYFPAMIFVSAVLLVGIYFFTTFESTAITTIEPLEAPTIFAPVETTSPPRTIPTTSTTQPSTTTTEPGTTTTEPPAITVGWEGTIDGFFDPACTMCHGTSGGIDLRSYDSAVEGGVSGPGIVPGDPEASVVFQRMKDGGHPAVLDRDQLEAFRSWIEAGAPEFPGEGPVVVAGETWDGGIADLFDARCSMCHGAASALDFASYDTALAGGNGTAIVPGDPDASLVIEKMDAGGHPGMFTEEELTRVRAWILAGAREGGGAAPDPDDDTPPATTDAVWLDIWAFFDPACTACHGENLQAGGLDLRTYDAATEGGISGPGIVPGASDASSLFLVQKRALSGGAHPQVLTDEQLEILRIWIDAGAPEN